MALWVLLSGNRLIVAGGLLAVLLVAYTALEFVGFTAVEEFGALESNIEDVSDYRERVRRETGQEVTPEEPAAFLELLLQSTRVEASRLQRTVAAIGDEELQADVDEMSDRLTDH